ncbi:MAG: carboxypeptidase-like regulatory domain-containing protein [Planctomycetota bacterium]
MKYRARLVVGLSAVLLLNSLCFQAGIAQSHYKDSDSRLRVVTGRISNKAGVPVAGASIEWGYFLADRNERDIVRSDKEGRFRLETRQVGIDYRLGVSALGYAPVWRDRVIPKLTDEEAGEESAGEPLSIDFVLEEKPISLRGTVFDNAGNPLQGIVVSAESASTGVYSSFSMPTPSFPFPGPPREGTTDKYGEFLIRHLPKIPSSAKQEDKGSPFRITFRSGDSNIKSAMAYSKGENIFQLHRPKPLIERESRTGSIRGLVYDVESEEPIRNFRIVIRHSPETREFHSEDGELVLPNLRAGAAVQFFVYADDYAPFVARPTILEDDAIEVQCALTRRKSIRGVVVDEEGNPIPDAKIAFGMLPKGPSGNRFYWTNFEQLQDGNSRMRFVQRSTTGEDGAFQFCDPGATFQLAVLAPGFARCVIPPAETETLSEKGELKVVLKKGANLRGKVQLNGKVDSSYRIRVDATESWDSDLGDHALDAEGRFQISSLTPGNYSIAVYANRSGGPIYVQHLKLVSGTSAEVVIDNPGGSLTLRGKAMPFAYVYAESKEPTEEKRFNFRGSGCYANAEGEYTIKGLWPGKYWVSTQQYSAISGYRGGGTRKELQLSSDDVIQDLFSPTRRLLIPSSSP